VFPSIVWAFLDRSIWPWDPAWYGEVSADLWATLRTDAGNWGTAMAHAFGAKPPAVAWLGQFFIPLGGALGGDSTVLLLSIVVTPLSRRTDLRDDVSRDARSARRPSTFTRSLAGLARTRQRGVERSARLGRRQLVCDQPSGGNRARPARECRHRTVRHRQGLR